MLVCLGAHNKGPQTGWLKQQKPILQWFWRLNIRNQGLAGLCPLRSLSLGHGWLLPASAHMAFPWHVCERREIPGVSSYKTPTYLIRAPTLWSHLTLIISSEVPSPNIAHYRLGLHHKFWGGHKHSCYYVPPPQIDVLFPCKIHLFHLYNPPILHSFQHQVSSLKSKFSFTCRLHQTWVTLRVGLILRQNSSEALSLWPRQLMCFQDVMLGQE